VAIVNSLRLSGNKSPKKLKGIVKIAAVDADVEKELGGRFGVKGFPTIKVFASSVGGKAEKKKAAQDYNGARTAKALIDYATTLLPSKNVAKIDSLGAFEKLDSSLPRVLLFSEKATSPPMFTAMSLEFHQRASFGFVKKTASEVVSKYGVAAFPTVVLVPAGEEATPVTYAGDLKPDLFLNFLKKQIAGEQPSQEPKDDGEKPKAKPNPKPEEDNSPAVVLEITSDAELNLQCEGKKHICLIAFLDPIADPNSQSSYLQTLQEVAEKNKKRYNVVWINSARQPDFFAHFQPADLPCLRVWNKKNGAVANVVASLTADSISRFLADVLTGKARTGKIAPPPALIEGGAPIPEPEPLVDEEVPVAQHEEL